MKFIVKINFESEYNLTDYAEELERLKERSGNETLQRWQILDFLAERFCEYVDTDLVRDNLEIEEVTL